MIESDLAGCQCVMAAWNSSRKIRAAVTILAVELGKYMSKYDCKSKYMSKYDCKSKYMSKYDCKSKYVNKHDCTRTSAPMCIVTVIKESRR